MYHIHTCYYYDSIRVFCNISVLYLKHIYTVCTAVHKLHYKELKWNNKNLLYECWMWSILFTQTFTLWTVEINATQMSDCSKTQLRCTKEYLLALVNWAGDLYGRILTKVVSKDQRQWGLYTRPRSRFFDTDWLSSVNKIFIIWQKQEQLNSLDVTGLY